MSLPGKRGRTASATKRAPAKAGRTTEAPRPQAKDVDAVVASLRRLATKATLNGMARYGIPSDNAFGVPVSAMQRLAKSLGRNHELALELWKTGWYEARMLAAFLDEPERVTPSQMESWCRDFDSWAICDTVCFHLFDRTPHAFGKVAKWGRRQEEFIKRAAFALLACLAGHDKNATDEQFEQFLPLVESAAGDERNFVKKGVSWALRGIGRRSPGLRAAATTVAERLATSPDAAARWVGKDTLRDLAKSGAKANAKRKNQ